MLSSLDPRAQLFLTNLNRISDRMSLAQNQITTGKRISQVSDDPAAVSQLISAHARLSSTSQNLDNLGRVKTEVDSAETALQNAVSLFEKVQTAGAQGLTDTLDAAGRNVIADQIDTSLQQLVGLTGTVVEGRYVFSGDADQTAPYTYDPSLANPLSAYLGTAATRQIQHPNGTTFSTSRTAQEIFDSTDPTKNVFSAIRKLSTALKANDTAAAQTAFDGLNKVNDHLNSELAAYGGTQNKVTNAQEFASTLKLQLQSQIAGYEEADLSESILELTQGQTQQQAALQSRALIPRKTLFDYLG